MYPLYSNPFLEHAFHYSFRICYGSFSLGPYVSSALTFWVNKMFNHAIRHEFPLQGIFQKAFFLETTIPLVRFYGIWGVILGSFGRCVVANVSLSKDHTRIDTNKNGYKPKKWILWILILLDIGYVCSNIEIILISCLLVYFLIGCDKAGSDWEMTKVWTSTFLLLQYVTHIY